jgi:hypothetical protein
MMTFLALRGCPPGELRVCTHSARQRGSPNVTNSEGVLQISCVRRGSHHRVTDAVDGSPGPEDDPHNAIIQDIGLAPRNEDGYVEYTATFFLVKPIEMSKP